MSTSFAAAEILDACLKTGSEADWVAFVQRFQPLIASSVSRVVRRYGPLNLALADDLVQETYVRLCKEDCRTLRTFKAQHDEAIFGLIKVIATTVAIDYYRSLNAQKRGNELQNKDDKEVAVTPADMERQTLLNQLNGHLAASESERDRTIFWLYYRQGFTAREIAAMRNFGLTQKGVEACIYRLTQLLRNAVKPPEKGKSPQDPLGEMT